MKKYSVIAALLFMIGIGFSSCHAGAHIGTKHHGAGVSTQVH